MFKDTRHVILGLSGGSDSMCLFHVLERLAEDMAKGDGEENHAGFMIHPVHVNHGIRKEATEDQRHCESFCEKKGLICRSFSYDCEEKAKEWGLSTEEAGRKLRYDSFEIVAREIEKEYKEPLDKIVVAIAQNADDQVETLAMRLLRGTGIDGLSGIPYTRMDSRGYRIVRPLLDVWKEEILEYCKEESIDYVTDETNGMPIYQRNKIRLELLPYLMENYNPKIKEAILRLGKSAMEDSSYLKKEAEEAFSKVYEEGALKVKELRKMDIAIKRRVLDLFFKNVGITEGITGEHFRNSLELINSEDPSGETMIPGGIKVYRSYDLLGIEKGIKEEEEKGEEATGLGELEISFISYEEYLRLKEEGLKNFACFDEKTFKERYGEDGPERILLRRRLPGDSIKLKMGTKKMQDLMVDDKVPKRERDFGRVLAIGSEVLWFIPKGDGRMRWTFDFAPREDSEKVMMIRLL